MLDLVLSDSAWSPEFIQELLPAAERVALLYHLSYLCLGKFPKLERILRERAVETQLLFGSSEAVLLKCVGTSDNLVKSLLPCLKVAVEKNKPQLALKFLEKAKEWIRDIISDVKEIVTRYNLHNNQVASSTSDIITEKEETKKKQQQLTKEMEAIQKIVDELDKNLHNITEEIEKSEEEIEKKNSEIQKFISSITSAKEKSTISTPALTPAAAMGQSVAIFSMIVPFVENIIGFVCKMVTDTAHAATIKTLDGELSQLSCEKQRLKEKEWDIQNKLMDNQLNLAKLHIENGQMPSVSHLDEVQKCLSGIQKLLIQLQKFWEKVGSLLDHLKQKTFAGEDMIEYLDDLKHEFLESIDAAKEGWTKFGSNCMKANSIFSIQANEAYKFLEISPSSLSKEKWEQEYASVIKKLENIRPTGPSQKAIMQ
ncbi:uncharacterized protein LOC127434557 [Myxocyprinus asiaticus]|uniref:uncharacterized protein LOC127434557 n=1 Tax=Myxocyprinus asiaticus TaxID=70543 RepID=UPI0022223690|nr:uncharacterized protein LOC127434557 [Myxocyprinus asiaticus]